MRSYALVLGALALAACSGKVSAPGSGGDPGGAGSPSGRGGGPSGPGSSGGGMTMEPAAPPPPPPYEAVPPASYGSKVKDALTGLPLTADELATLTAAKGAPGPLQQ